MGRTVEGRKEVRRRLVGAALVCGGIAFSAPDVAAGHAVAAHTPKPVKVTIINASLGDMRMTPKHAVHAFDLVMMLIPGALGIKSGLPLLIGRKRKQSDAKKQPR